MWSAKAFKRYGVAIALTAFATMVPVSVSSSGQPEVNDACADGACCRELASFCGELLDHYLSLSGHCRIKGAQMVTPTAQPTNPDA